MNAANAATAVYAHHYAQVNGTELQPTSSPARAASRCLLVHGFPESWWTFRKLIPLLRRAAHARHRRRPARLRRLPPSPVPTTTTRPAAIDLAALIERLDLGPAHLTGQDISGPTVYRLAGQAARAGAQPDDDRDRAAGFGLELLRRRHPRRRLAHRRAGRAGDPEAAAGRPRARFLAEYAIPSLTATAGAFTDADLDELARGYARDGGFAAPPASTARCSPTARRSKRSPRSAAGWRCRCSRSAAARATSRPPRCASVADDVTALTLDGVGHYVAMEALERARRRSCWRSGPGRPRRRCASAARVLAAALNARRPGR